MNPSLMMKWNKRSLKDFFQSHSYKNLCVEDLERQIRIEFQVFETSEIDLCSQTLLEVECHSNILGIELNVTLHDSFLGIHLFVSAPDDDPSKQQSKISLPAEIPYSKLEIRVIDSLALE